MEAINGGNGQIKKALDEIKTGKGTKIHNKKELDIFFNYDIINL